MNDGFLRGFSYPIILCACHSECGFETPTSSSLMSGRQAYGGGPGVSAGEG